MNEVTVNSKVIYTGKSNRKWNGIVLASDPVTGQLAVRWTSFGPGKEVTKFQITPPAEVTAGEHLMKDLEKKAEVAKPKVDTLIPGPAPKKAPAKEATKK